MQKIFYDYQRNIVEKPDGAEVFWRPWAYGLLRNEKGEILLVMPHTNPMLELPWWGIDTFEEFHESLEREFYEETGFAVETITPLPIHIAQNLFYVKKRDKFCHTLYFLYECRLSWKDLSKKYWETHHEDTMAQVVWVHPKDITRKNCHANSYKVLKEVLNLAE